MSEVRSRGYLIPSTAKFLRDNVDAAEWERINRTLSPELRIALDRGPEPAGWYPIALLDELNRHIAHSMGHGDEDRTKKAFYDSARNAASEASNSFLKLVLRMLTPALIAKKIPDLFRRDFSSEGTVSIEVTPQKVTGRLRNLSGFPYCGVLCPGFTGFAIEATGGTVDKVTVHDWSLAKPNPNETWFELWWH